MQSFAVESKHPSTTTVIVGMSGVDSSVAAHLLKQQGYAVQGLFMKNWDEDDGTEYCTAIADLEDAQAVCERLDIPLHCANFAAEYWDNVFEHFLAEYQRLENAQPRHIRNREIKFRQFVNYAGKPGADYIATGHYARRSVTKPVLSSRKQLTATKIKLIFYRPCPNASCKSACSH